MQKSKPTISHRTVQCTYNKCIYKMYDDLDPIIGSGFGTIWFRINLINMQHSNVKYTYWIKKVRLACSGHFTSLTHSPESLNIQQTSLSDVPESWTINMISYQVWAWKVSPNSITAVITALNPVGVGRMFSHGANQFPASTRSLNKTSWHLCVVFPTGDHTWSETSFQSAAWLTWKKPARNPKQQKSWSMSYVYNGILSTMLWASRGKAKPTTVYSAVHPSISRSEL